MGGEIDELSGDLVDARFRQGDLPEQQGLGPLELVRADRSRLHPCSGRARLMIPGPFATFRGSQPKVDAVERTRHPYVEGRRHVIDEPRLLSQVTVEPGGVEGAAQDVIAQLEGIVVRVRPGEAEGLREGHLGLDPAEVRHIRGGGLVGRAQGAGMSRATGPVAFHEPKYFSMTALAVFRRHLAHDDDGGQIGPEDLS